MMFTEVRGKFDNGANRRYVTTVHSIRIPAYRFDDLAIWPSPENILPRFGDSYIQAYLRAPGVCAKHFLAG